MISDEEKIETLDKAMDLFEHVRMIETGDEQEDALFNAEARRAVEVLEAIRAEIMRLSRPKIRATGSATQH